MAHDYVKRVGGTQAWGHSVTGGLVALGLSRGKYTKRPTTLVPSPRAPMRSNNREFPNAPWSWRNQRPRCLPQTRYSPRERGTVHDVQYFRSQSNWHGPLTPFTSIENTPNQGCILIRSEPMGTRTLENKLRLGVRLGVRLEEQTSSCSQKPIDIYCERLGQGDAHSVSHSARERADATENTYYRSVPLASKQTHSHSRDRTSSASRPIPRDILRKRTPHASRALAAATGEPRAPAQSATSISKRRHSSKSGNN